MNSNNLIIAVDFDGTIVEDGYPKIGTTQIFAFETLRKLQNEGYRLILWTYRSGSRLDEAVAFCKDNGVEFYAVNKSFPEEKFDPKYSRKINADLFIDDRNIGGFIGWTEVYKHIFNYEAVPKKKKGFFSFFK
ncbi:hydrolase [Polaribacter sp. ALD11]|uniref:BT0820 family HAD-type phosphatase n=1 Tax=Polaribacter sp. ALD11 TaxID=2058137 RepID=UPI000C304766|nr:hydrolase [Polaribacter sp. ALD11]AUC85346.1 hydrolase [Polaribacter sp. ALD11]